MKSYTLEEIHEKLNSYKPTLKDKIVRFFTYTLVDWYYSFINGCKSLWFWFPVIWKSRGWDYIYLYRIMSHQLKRMKECKKHSYHLSADRDIKNMTICIELLKRLEEDNYYLNNRVTKMKIINFKKAFDLEDCLEKRDRELLFKIMKNQINHWWS